MTVTEKVNRFLFKEVSAAPLIIFRFAFGIMMFLSLARFVANGWIDVLYLEPTFFFTYYGFEWIKPLNATGMYVLFAIMMVAALLVAFGTFYRASIVVFFLLFTYVELIDKSNYLNHYYFISIVSFLLCLLPEGKNTVPRWAILTLQLQMAMVYFFAGIAKINTDWLWNAMPLKIWLASKSDLPLIGNLLTEDWVAYLFSWCGMLFDVFIAFFLFHRRTVWYAYAMVIVFHVLTAILFPMIGMFPFIMIVCATIFLPEVFHQRILQNASYKWSGAHSHSPFKLRSAQLVLAVLSVHFLIQTALPFRYLLYPSNLKWHEQGYRFSWRVMLMEKAGTVFFYVKNENGALSEVRAAEHLTPQQEKQMSTQPDMILQFAHHLQEVYQTREVYAEAYATVNGRPSTLYINPNVNLCKESDGFENKGWILARR